MTTFNKVTREKILEILKQVQEPVMQEDIISLGLVREIEINQKHVFLHLEDVSQDGEVRERLQHDIHQTLCAADGVEQVTVHFSGKVKKEPMQTPLTPIPGVRHIIAVASGKGGVGKTTVAVNLALALQKMGAKVGLMDGDIYGPNIPIMLGISPEKRPAGNEEGRIIPLEAHGIQTISIGFFANPEQPVIWRGPLLHKTIEQFLHHVVWGELDYLVVDLPPGTGDVQLSLVQWVPLAGAVIVSTPQEVALSDVRKAVHMFRQLEVRILGVIENMTGPVFGQGGGRKMAEIFQIPFLGDIPLMPEIRECGDSGVPVIVGEPTSSIRERFMKIAEAIRHTLK